MVIKEATLQRDRSDGVPEVVDVTLQEKLTPRELEVLRILLRGGLGNRAIAKELVLAEVTVKKHIQSIYQKFGVSDRTQLALMALRMGISPASVVAQD